MSEDYTPKQIVEMLEMEQEDHQIAAIVEGCWSTIKAALLAYVPPDTHRVPWYVGAGLE